MQLPWRIYVCGQCGYGQWHPLSWCPKCPGKLKRTECITPRDQFSSESDEDYEKYTNDYLAKLGVTNYGKI